MAFQAKAYEYHPDKNRNDPQSATRFQEVNEAYSILKNETKRRNYDEFGHSSHVTETGKYGFFSNLFGTFSTPDSSIPFFHKKASKTKTYYYNVNVLLKELYNGCTKKVIIPLQRICTRCDGQGTNDKSLTPLCNDCKGTGRITKIYRRGRTVYKDESFCRMCQGTGYYIPEIMRCSNCKGEKTRKENIPFEFEIERGMEDGDTIVISGESNDEPGYERGDLEIVLHELRDEIFTRHKENLLYKKNLSLTESLAGYSFMIRTLDDRILRVFSESPVRNGDVICIQGEGMPCSGASLKKGDLYIEFSVITPDVIHEEVKKALWKFMPPVKSEDSENDEANIFTPKFIKSTIDEFKRSTSARINEREDNSESYEGKPKNQSNACQPM